MPPKISQKTNHIVKESNALARARIIPNSVTVWDERVIAAIAALNTISDTGFQLRKLDARELIGKALSTRQYNELKNAIKKLLHKTFELPLGKRGIEGYPIFALLKPDDDGVITGKINPELKPHYLELRQQFAMRSLTNFQKLTSIYSQKLYRFLNSWKNVSDNEKIVVLNELHEILQTPESLRKNFSLFRVRVLNVAHKEINAVAENSAEKNLALEFEWEPVKEGKQGETSKVVAVKFIFNVSGRNMAARIEKLREYLKKSTRKNTDAEERKPGENEKHISEFFSG